MTDTVSSMCSGSTPRMPAPAQANWPSYLYVMSFAVNTVLISMFASSLWVLPLLLLQGFFFVGLLELTHQSVHRRFVSSSRVNELLGTLAAGLIGFNLIAYRYFHFEHHRHTCDESDPEGLLYAGSPSSRWLWLVAPAAQLWLALAINRLAPRYVPKARRRSWMRARLGLTLALSGVLTFAVLAPRSFLMAYLLPFCLFAWIDFLFSQAEHYGAEIRKSTVHADVASVTYDIQVPLLLSQLMLNRNLHRVHHVWPRTRWFEAPKRLAALEAFQPARVLGFFSFGARWMTHGPRLWEVVSQPASGTMQADELRPRSLNNTKAMQAGTAS